MSKEEPASYVVLDDKYRLVPYTYGWKVVRVYEGKTKEGAPAIKEETLAYFSRLETAVRWVLAWDAREQLMEERIKADVEALLKMLEVRVDKISGDLLG